MNFPVKFGNKKVVVFEVGVGNLFASKSKSLIAENPHWHFSLLEPNPILYQELLKATREAPNVSVINCAIHSVSGFFNFVMASDRSFLSGLYSPMQKMYHGKFEHLFEGYTIPVYCSPLSTYDKGDIDILFLGMEGHEWAAISTMNSRPKIIFLPNHAANDYGYMPPNMDLIINWFNSNGYVLVRHTPDEIVCVNRDALIA